MSRFEHLGRNHRVVDVVPGDRTLDCVRRVSESDPEMRVQERMGRRGVGNTVRTGIRIARGEVVVVAMGDRSENPNDIIRLASQELSGL